MAKEFSFVTGVAEADLAMANFPIVVRKQLLRSATRIIAKKIKLDAEAIAPRDTGFLASAIRVRAVARIRGKGARSRRGVIGASVRVGEGMFKGKSFYGGFLEFGTGERVTKSGRVTGQILAKAFAFLRPALYRNREYARTEFANAVRQAIAMLRRQRVKKAAPEVDPDAGWRAAVAQIRAARARGAARFEAQIGKYQRRAEKTRAIETRKLEKIRAKTRKLIERL